ncbi:MAG: iron-sulfur cluster repair di-iron protein [Alicyclobacillaceae bacterium]|nr:iron-sulfur cluster repair di-iron protein [Alicyclobacillaceae bacterium]
MFSPNDTLGDIVARFPKAAEVFRKHGMDYCCGGQRPLSEAAAQQRVDADELLQEIQRLHRSVQQSATSEPDWSQRPLADLIDHVVQVHHAYLNTTLPVMGELVTKVLRVHGANHPALQAVHRLYHQLQADFEAHLIKEETQVFPLIARWEGAPDAVDVGMVTAAIRELEGEHDATGRLLRALRSVTHDYAIPDDACGTYYYVYTKLKELEEKTFTHVHLENNILFPRVYAYEPQR